MADGARLTMRKNFPRPGAGEAAPFREAPTGAVVDAMGRRGALPHWLRPLTSATRFCGPALTVWTRPVDNLAPYAALAVARPGDVLLVAVDAGESAAIVGDVLIGMARNAGVAAVVTDGLARDAAGIESVGIPVFARGLTPNSPFKDGPGSVGLPVTIGGLIIHPGDLVVGDADGVAIVPRNDLPAVTEALAAVSEKEAAMERAVAEGAARPDWLAGVLASDRVRWLD